MQLLLGISEPGGNFSASEHNLGPQILANPSAEAAVSALAQAFIERKDAAAVPDLVRAAQIRFLGIGVGSEASCMLNPKVYYTTNSRTLWMHFAHIWDVEKASTLLDGARDGDSTSELAYKNWSEYHGWVGETMRKLGRYNIRSSIRGSLQPFLWADAIATKTYSVHHPAKRKISFRRG
ncbi:MAG: hypothetical protein ACHP7I_04560 [Terriglobales bacterium]